MNYKCIKCKEFKSKDGYDDKWFKVVKKICLKCEMLIKEREIKGRMMKREMDILDAHQKKIAKLRKQGAVVKYAEAFDDKGVWGKNKYGNIWMKKGDKSTAYKKEKNGYRPFRTFISKYSGKEMIRVKWTNGPARFYELEQMHSWIH